MPRASSLIVACMYVITVSVSVCECTGCSRAQQAHAHAHTRRYLICLSAQARLRGASLTPWHTKTTLVTITLLTPRTQLRHRWRQLARLCVLRLHKPYRRGVRHGQAVLPPDHQGGAPPAGLRPHGGLQRHAAAAGGAEGGGGVRL